MHALPVYCCFFFPLCRRPLRLRFSLLCERERRRRSPPLRRRRRRHRDKIHPRRSRPAVSAGRTITTWPLSGAAWAGTVPPCTAAARLWRRPSLPAATWAGRASTAAASPARPCWPRRAASATCATPTTSPTSASPSRPGPSRTIAPALPRTPRISPTRSRAIWKPRWSDWASK